MLICFLGVESQPERGCDDDAGARAAFSVMRAQDAERQAIIFGYVILI